MNIKVRWQVDDGYAGKSRPQETKFYIDDDEWVEMDDNEQYDYAWTEVYCDFENKVRPGFSPDDIEVIADE